MKRHQHQYTAPLTPQERFQIQQALIRHETIMRQSRSESISDRISRSEGEYERLSVLAALRHAAGPELPGSVSGCTVEPGDGKTKVL